MKITLPASIRMKLIAFKAAKIVITFVIAVLAVHSVLMILWGRQLEGKLSDLKKQGFAVNVTEIVPSPVPDDQNAAVVYKKAFAAAGIDSSFKQDEPLTPVYDYVDPQTSPAKRAKLEPQVRKLLEQCKPAFPIIDQAVSRPVCVFPVRWQDGANALLPHLSQLRRLEKLLAAKAVMESKDGDLETALNDFALGLGVSHALDSEPCLVSYLVKLSEVRIALDGLMESTRAQRLSTAQADRLTSLLQKQDMYSGFDLAMRGEIAATNSIFDMARKDAEGFDAQISTLNGWSSSSKIPVKLMWYLWRPVSYKEQAFIAGQWPRVFPEMKKPYRQMHGNIRLWEATPRYSLIWRMFRPQYPRILAARDEATAHVGLAQTAMALKSYKSRFRSYPASLDELKQKLGRGLPGDPFSGKPFIYTRQGSGFKLYSIGQDLKDDGGKPSKEQSWPTTSGTADIVWVSEV